MNESFGKIATAAPSTSQNAVGSGGRIVQITSLPEGLQNTQKAQRLDGQISQINNNGTVRISTGAGDVDVKIRGRNQPSVGQKFTIEVPVGKPARQGIILPTPASQGATDTKNQTANASRSTSSTNSITNPPNLPTGTIQVSRNSIAPTTPNAPPQPSVNTAEPLSVTQRTTIIQPQLPPITTQGSNTQAPAAPLANTPSTPNAPVNQAPQIQAANVLENAIVRLLAVPPAQAQNIATASFQSQAPAQLNIINQSQALLTPNLAVPNLTTILPQTPAPPPALSTPPTLSPTPNNAPQTIVNNSILPNITAQPITTQSITTLPPVTTSPTLPAAQTLPVSAAGTLLTQSTLAQAITPPVISPTAPLNASLTPLPLNFDPTVPPINTQTNIQKIDVQIIKVTPPNIVIAPLSSTAPPPATIVPALTNFTPPLLSVNNAASLSGQVTGFTQAGLPLVTLRLPGAPLPQSFILQSRNANLQLGTQLQIIPKTAAGATAAPTPLPTLRMGNPLLQGFQWPAMDDLYQTLSQISPQAASSLSRALPNAGNPSQIGPAAMMFIAAIKSGDIGGWLGNNKLDLLQRAGKDSILSQLTQGSATARGAPAAEPLSASDWRAVPLPMFWEGEIHKITLYTRQEGQNHKQDQNDGNNQTRFIFDLSLTRMGEVQLDGLLRDKRLDLVIRTQNAFSPSMQQTMRQAYGTALTQTELSGDLDFQGSTSNWVHVLEEKEQLGVDV